MGRKRKKRSRLSKRWKKIKSKLLTNPLNLGIVLFLCVAVGVISYVLIKPKQPKSAGAWGSNLGESKAPAERTTRDDPSAADPTRETEEAGGSKSSDLGTGDSDSDKKPASDRDAIDSLPGMESRKIKTPKIVVPETKADLLEKLLNVRKQFTLAKSQPVNFVNAQDSRKLALRLLEMDVSESEELFVISSLIESALMLDSLNMKENLKAEHVRGYLIAARDKYCNHPDKTIGSKASLAFPLIPLHNYYGSNDESELVAVADQFDLHGGKIIRNPEVAALFVQLIISRYKDSDHSAAYRELAIRVMKRMKNVEEPIIGNLVNSIGEYVYFARSDLGTLVSRIEGGNRIARADVQSLFDGLDANPSSRLEVYKVAANVIAEYLRLGHTEDSDALLKWFVSINERNGSQSNREAIEKGIAEFMKIRQSDNPKELIPAPN